MTLEDAEAVIALIRSEPGGTSPQRTPNAFIDPSNDSYYLWPKNHSTEEAMSRSRQMGDGAPTDNKELLPQAGVTKPLVMQWKGRLLTRNQLYAMMDWWSICDDHSIFVLNFRDELYEVLITDFSTQVVGVALNPADRENAPRNVWDYTLTMRVLTVLTPPWPGPWMRG